jgi:hypothetical protein
LKNDARAPNEEAQSREKLHAAVGPLPANYQQIAKQLPANYEFASELKDHS